MLARGKQLIAQKAQKSKRLNDVIDKATAAAKAKGWFARVTNKDSSGFRYASLEVSRSFNNEHITGTMDLEVSDTAIKSQVHKTSFYGHGLEALQSAVMDSISTLPGVKPKEAAKRPDPPSPTAAALMNLDGMLRRFDRYARQLNRRHADRTGIVVQDEYDAQDLLHALLRSVFDDVRAEEVTPSYAGGSSRVDFLLKKEHIIIEVKLASPKLRDKDVGEQLIVDIKRYQAHPDCKTLLCLVYDPGNHIKNPQGLESDLTGRHDDVDVRVYVVPQ